MAPTNQSTQSILAFVDDLRDQGLLVGSPEASDAVRIITDIGLYSREQTKLALMSIFAKTPKDQRIFNRSFDSFFVGEQELTEQQERREEEEQARQERLDEAREALSDHDVTEEFTEAFASVSDEHQKWLRTLLDNVKSRNTKPDLMISYLDRVATGWIAADAAIGLEGIEEDDLLHKDLSQIDEEEVAQALQLIETLVMRIRLASDRKHRRSGRRGMPDLRATIHASLRTGGIPLVPLYRRRPRPSKEIVVLCDVSESMFQYSKFALALIAALVRNRNKARAFIFSEQTEEVDLSNIADFERRVKSSNLWRKGTDCGAAFEALLGFRPPVVTSSALLIVISDARTVDQESAWEGFIETSRRAREVIWLNPDKQFGELAQRLAKECTMLGCNTLSDLAEACAQLSLA